LSDDEKRRSLDAQAQAMGHPAPPESTHTRVYQGGTAWSIAAVAAAALGSVRLWTLVPVALERFALGSCRPSPASAQLTWPGIAMVVLGGLAALGLAEYGIRREGNRWLSMVGSVVGVSCLIGGACLALALLAPPLSCTP